MTGHGKGLTTAQLLCNSEALHKINYLYTLTACVQQDQNESVLRENVRNDLTNITVNNSLYELAG